MFQVGMKHLASSIARLLLQTSNLKQLPNHIMTTKRTTPTSPTPEQDPKRLCQTSQNNNNNNNKQAQKKNGSKRSRKNKNKIFLQHQLTTSEQSLELSIKGLIGDQIYDDLVEKYNQFVTTKSESADRQQGWKDSGWDLGDSISSAKQVQVEIFALSSFGDGIGLSPNKKWAVVVPFCVPGDVVISKIHRHTPTHSLGDLISVIKPGELRNDELTRCKYFGKCSGCQFQMIEYSKQLDIKKTTVQKAFEQFSGLEPGSIPTVESTLASPKQYEYRTKLTPHFELPRKMKNKKPTEQIIDDSTKEGEVDDLKIEDDGYHAGPGGLAIGLAEKGRRRVVDIEECVLGTKTINEKLKTERARVQSTIDTFKRGATLLLRESLVPNDPNSGERIDQEENKICVTNHKTIVREKVLDKIFEQNAGSFFQNNPSILGPFIEYIIENLITTVKTEEEEPDQQRFLVDAYCGSGLFSISLAHHFTKTIGIELCSDSLFYAKRNAELNNVTNANFIVGEAEAIFKDLTFPPSQTTILIDPPRKGCSMEFIDQLRDFKPARIIYISCNVITQAQDIKHIKDLYRVTRIRGLDFFPQTYHCESVALLDLTGP